MPSRDHLSDLTGQAQLVEIPPVNFEPFHDRVLVKQDEAPAELAQGRIQIPDSQKERPLEGLVVAVGQGRYEFGQWIRPMAAIGQKVLFSRHAGTEIEVDGVTYLLMRDEELVGRRRPTGLTEVKR